MPGSKQTIPLWRQKRRLLTLERALTPDRKDSGRSAIQQTVSHFGKLDILYNCAGGSIVQDAPVTDVDMSVWQHTISLDLLETFHCCRHGIPELTKSGGGAIVNMSSVAALRGFPAHVYVAAKGGIISLTRALAGEYAKNGIRANAICPGLVKTDRVLQRFGNPDDRADVPRILDVDRDDHERNPEERDHERRPGDEADAGRACLHQSASKAPRRLATTR